MVARLLWHLRCNVLAYDFHENDDLKKLGVKYVSQEELLAQSDIVTLNCPLTEQTKHLIGRQTLATLKRGVMVVNTGRGALIDTSAAVDVRTPTATVHTVSP